MLRLVLLALILAAVMLDATRHRRSRAAAGSRPNKDAMTLHHLARVGSNLARPHDAEFFLYLPTEEAARAVAGRYASEGFNYTLHRDPNGTEWTCVLRKSMILSTATLTRLRTEFSEVASAYGGNYDGWGTEVER